MLKLLINKQGGEKVGGGGLGLEEGERTGLRSRREEDILLSGA